MRLTFSLCVRAVLVMILGACMPVQAAVAQSTMQARVAARAAMFLDTSTDNGPKPTDGIAINDQDKSRWGWSMGWLRHRPLAMGAGILFTALVLMVLTRGKPQRLLLGQDNRYSNSKCQFMLWFFIVISAYITVFLVRLKNGIVGGIGIPPHLLLLSGFSAVTFAGAKAITTSKVNNAEAMGLANPKPSAQVIAPAVVAVPIAGGVEAVAPVVVIAVRSFKYLISDLTTNDGLKIANPAGGPPLVTPPTMDIGDTQMIVIALVVVLTYLVIIYNYLGSTNFGLTPGVVLPDVDSTMLSLFGLGQGAYLSKKAVGNAGES